MYKFDFNEKIPSDQYENDIPGAIARGVLGFSRHVLHFMFDIFLYTFNDLIKKINKNHQKCVLVQ